jgi:hypothetical protein
LQHVVQADARPCRRDHRFPARPLEILCRGNGCGPAADGAVPRLGPDAFIRNVLLFNLVRSPDGTSWRLFAPAWLGRVASLGALGFWLAGSAWLAWRSRNANSSTGAEGCPVRLALFVAVTLGLIMTGSTAHDDYMIWWMPAVLAIIPLEIGLGRRTAQGRGRDAGGGRLCARCVRVSGV